MSYGGGGYGGGGRRRRRGEIAVCLVRLQQH